MFFFFLPWKTKIQSLSIIHSSRELELIEFLVCSSIFYLDTFVAGASQEGPERGAQEKAGPEERPARCGGAAGQGRRGAGLNN